MLAQSGKKIVGEENKPINTFIGGGRFVKNSR